MIDKNRPLPPLLTYTDVVATTAGTVRAAAVDVAEVGFALVETRDGGQFVVKEMRIDGPADRIADDLAEVVREWLARPAGLDLLIFLPSKDGRS